MINLTPAQIISNQLGPHSTEEEVQNLISMFEDICNLCGPTLKKTVVEDCLILVSDCSLYYIAYDKPSGKYYWETKPLVNI